MELNPGRGELFSLLSALAWAVGVILYRQLGARLPPLALNFLKNCLVLAMLVPAVPLLHGLALPVFGAGELALVLASGAIGIAIADTLYFRALNELGAGRMGILGNFYSPAVIVLGYAFLGERLSALQGLGFVLVSAGIWVAAWPRREPGLAPPRRLHGAVLALAAIVLMAVAVVMVKRVLEAQPLLWVTGLRMVGALLAMLALAAATGRLRGLLPPATGLPWGRLLLAAFVGQFLAMILWMAGYKYTQASVAAILNESASVFILLLAAWWLREPLTRRSAAGVALTLAGVVVMLLN